MSDLSVELPSRVRLRRHVIDSLSRYWPKNSNFIEGLLFSDYCNQKINAPLVLQSVLLPDWAVQWGIDGKILVPSEACGNIISTEKVDWQQVDWWLAVFLMLECWHERVWEQKEGIIHSYSFKLEGWDERVWQAAWVNRIALFLREWAARNNNKSAHDCFGDIPRAEIVVTHDVDAINKTTSIRLKQGVFNLYNSGRHLLKGEIKQAIEKVRIGARFLLGSEDWWIFDQLLEVERNAGIKAQFNFYADCRKKLLKSWLFDPSYDIDQEKVKQLFQQIKEQGGIIGLHPTFDAWKQPEEIQKQKKWLSEVSETEITTCRQHWLRFSWAKTWSAQVKAGIRHDTTLMFNDKSGFRAAAALQWQPWNADHSCTHEVTVIPTVLMDSHFYDYSPMQQQERHEAIRKWTEECKRVGGQIAVLWHPHTLTKDYGWSDGFDVLITHAATVRQ
jgi:hypothetical protein